MIRQRRPVIDHGTRKGDRTNPHRGDCVGTLCTACGCCQHCADDGADEGHCPGTPGCAGQGCYCQYTLSTTG